MFGRILEDISTCVVGCIVIVIDVGSREPKFIFFVKMGRQGRRRRVGGFCLPKSGPMQSGLEYTVLQFGSTHLRTFCELSIVFLSVVGANPLLEDAVSRL